MQEETVIDRLGARGRISEKSAAGGAAVLLEDGETIHVGLDQLTEVRRGEYRFDGAFADLATAASERDVSDRDVSDRDMDEQKVTLAEETLKIGRRERETARVFIEKHVRERIETVDEPIYEDVVDVRRVPVDRVVEQAVPVRQDGDTTIIPILEERLVITRQLVLKEELHVTKRKTEHRETHEVSLRSEDVSVRRDRVRPEDASSTSHPPHTGTPHTESSTDQ